jgi:hypothetical protein
LHKCPHHRNVNHKGAAFSTERNVYKTSAVGQVICQQDNHTFNMAEKPTIVLIPGACTEASCFDRLRPYLHDAGYETVPVSHTSANPTDPYAHTAETMALNVQENYVQPLLDAGKQVLVYAYSSGGSQTGTHGPSWVFSDREARGVKGGVIGIVYMSCAPVPAGVDQLTYMGGAWPPFVKANVVCTVLYLSHEKLLKM